MVTNTATAPSSLLFILGVLRRSGTNYLSDLVTLHPDCRRVEGVWEDFILAHADKLEAYVRAVSGSWNPAWDADGAMSGELRRRLGEACIAFLASRVRQGGDRPPRYTVAKSPSVRNIRRITLFPGARTMVIVRDGRDVVESGMKSFDWDFQQAVRRWDDAAKTIMRARRKKVPFHLVRFEDLIKDHASEMLRIFEYLGLDPGCCDFEAARDLPVRGSSEMCKAGGTLHWEGVNKADGFNPVKRWTDWSPAQLAFFDEVAGETNAWFGYDRQ